MKTWKPLLVAALALALVGVLTGTQPLMLGGGNAHAIIGRPLTPMSYAGVARRSVRRGAYYGGAYGGAAVAGAAVAGAAVGAAAVSTLPAGCVMGGGIYTCGSVRYRPYYDGPTVVYQPY
jgi:hypothetical protein